MTADLRFYIFLSFSKFLVFIYILSNCLTNIYLSDNNVIFTKSYLFVCSLWSQCTVSFYISNSMNGKIIKNNGFMSFNLLRVMHLLFFRMWHIVYIGIVHNEYIGHFFSFFKNLYHPQAMVTVCRGIRNGNISHE